MKFKDVKILAGGLAAQIISISAMWCWTDIEIEGVAFLSFYAMGAGMAVAAWLEHRKKVPAKQRKPPKIYTYTRGGVCLEGVYEQLKIG